MVEIRYGDRYFAYLISVNWLIMLSMKLKINDNASGTHIYSSLFWWCKSKESLWMIHIENCAHLLHWPRK